MTQIAATFEYMKKHPQPSSLNERDLRDLESEYGVKFPPPFVALSQFAHPQVVFPSCPNHTEARELFAELLSCSTSDLPAFAWIIDVHDQGYAVHYFLADSKDENPQVWEYTEGDDAPCMAPWRLDSYITAGVSRLVFGADVMSN
ncbi:MAG: hypothetical protein AAF823_15715 [Planctomycetota bacterium]